ncbi:MAG: hypothetical protein ABIY70_11545 [Capsulimonas sp.]|uniref:hypothetical protein n=1 Tax=Capsulimonas sp. TaxID=2494211 RepID=UPI0032659301
MSEQRHVLSVEDVRNRPAMFVGSRDHHGIFNTVCEIYGYYANEIFAGAFTDLEIILHSDRSISITGRESHSEKPKDQAYSQTRSIQSLAEELIHRPKTIDYRMGVDHIGVSIVNCLSQWLVFHVKRGDSDHRFRWERGKYVSPSPPIDLIAGDELTIHWMPDPEIFGDAQLSAIDVERFLTKMAPLLREAKHRFSDRLTQRQPLPYSSDRGLSHLVEYLNGPYTAIGQTIHRLTSQPDANGDLMEIEFAVQFHREPGETIISVANMHFTNAGGAHADGLMAGFHAALREIEHDNAERQRVTFGPGYTAAISVRLRHPRFEYSTRSGLGNDEIREDVVGIVHQAMRDGLAQDEHLRRTIEYS